ncbi:hypothetical protein H3T52_07850 [Commensalibacter sp. M0402]|uniref:hypothetical protein n=1 Tax=Commensalibacter TaxID=1079922 RepID=UPI0018DCAABC|nr:MULTISPECIES: hypothetical protein [Commensalibacter]MBI0083547.1 hypothetical protein [Commensalibacter sp. W6292M3]MBI0088858.1 hypothetical protein [Commensalibacter melissae]
MDNNSLSIVKNAARKQFRLTVRQFAIMTMVYMDGIEESVNYYANDLNISKPSVCKALNHLEEIHLVKREKIYATIEKSKLQKLILVSST